MLDTGEGGMNWRELFRRRPDGRCEPAPEQPVTVSQAAAAMAIRAAAVRKARERNKIIDTANKIALAHGKPLIPRRPG